MRRKSIWWALIGALCGAALAFVWRKRVRDTCARKSHNREMRVLVLGSGAIAGAYAARLAHSGMRVTLVAREERWRQIREEGLRTRDVPGLATRCAPVTLASAVSRDEKADLVLVAVPHTQLAETYEAVRHLASSAPILLLGDIGLGPGSVGKMLSERQVLLGAPGTAGGMADGVVRTLPMWLGATLLGESDGSITDRSLQAASILRAAGLRVEIEPEIESYLRTQAAGVAVLAGCIYRNGGSVRRMARSRVETLRYLAVLRETYAVLGANAIPVTPVSQLRIFDRPLWLQVALVRVVAWAPWVAWVIDNHVEQTFDEMRTLYQQLLALCENAQVEASAVASLSQYFVKD